jgi:serine/threonine protein kinase
VIDPPLEELRKESTKLLLAETVDHLSRDISQVREDVEDLARKLMQVDPDAFGLLRCHGVLRNLDTNGQLSSIDILYQTPKDSSQPTSLRELLLDQKPVSVSAIMRLVKQLVRSVSYIHACNFVHKNIRPENIIVFQGPNSPLGSTFLLGFSHFRNTNFQTNLIGDPAWHRNLYRHPQRQGTLVQDRYVMQHDIYSLGVCLLEIGLWKPFVWYPISGEHGEPVPGLVLEFKLSDAQFATVGSAASLGIKEHLVELAKNNLPSRLGDMYTEIVLACLNCLDPENEEFGSVKDLVDGDGVTVGVRFIEKVLIRINEITV